MNVDNWINNRTIFSCVAGSVAYGLNTPDSDEDFRGVCIPPLDYFLGLHKFEQKDSGWPDGADRAVFGISKFVELALNSNPNIIEFLWIPEDCIRFTTPTWDWLRENRNLFLSKKLKHTYGGYAHSQLRRIESHRRWLLDPPTHAPDRAEFGLQPKRMSPELFGVMENIFAGQNEASSEETVDAEFGIDRAAIFAVFEKERKWRAARKNWEQYENWLRNRNPKRAEMERKFGYDTKHAGHLFRLMIQGEQALLTGEIPVRLTGADLSFCKAIKEGAFKFDEILSLAELSSRRMEQALLSSTLPHGPAHAAVNELVKELVVGYFTNNGDLKCYRGDL